MTAQQNEVWTTNPKQDLIDTYGYTLTRLQRAPDSGGAAGAFADIATFAFDPSDEATRYVDSGGEDTSWYQWRWEHPTDVTKRSNYSPAIQAGDSIIRQWLRSDIPDKDVTTSMWDRWTKQTFIDLYSAGIWKIARATVAITKASDGTKNEWYDIPAKIRDVLGLELVSNDANLRHVAYLSSGEWEQVGRQIRVTRANDTYKYQIFGKAQFVAIGELTDDYFMLAYRMIRSKLLAFRINQRANFYKNILYDKRSDIDIPDLRAMKADADADIARDIRALALPEPIVPEGWART